MEELMSIKERILFRTTIKNTKHYFEFGAGGSTYYVCSIPTVETITSVESDMVYINKIKILCPRANILFADIGPTKEWGYPINKAYNWANYCNMWDKRCIEPDTVLIDGRFRVACALKIILTSNPLIIIHDFLNRKQYHILLEFLYIVESVDTLVICRKKPILNIEHIQNLLDKYMLIPE